MLQARAERTTFPNTPTTLCTLEHWSSDPDGPAQVLEFFSSEGLGEEIGDVFDAGKVLEIDVTTPCKLSSVLVSNIDMLSLLGVVSVLRRLDRALVVAMDDGGGDIVTELREERSDPDEVLATGRKSNKLCFEGRATDRLLSA
jgi:hypothetical protein